MCDEGYFEDTNGCAPAQGQKIELNACATTSPTQDTQCADLKVCATTHVVFTGGKILLLPIEVGEPSFSQKRKLTVCKDFTIEDSSRSWSKN